METVLLRRIHEKIQRFLLSPQELFLVVSIDTQTLLLCSNDTIVERYDASTSRFGIGNRENSLKTPLGLHRIKEKFGAGAPAGRIFTDREDTGVDWDHSLTRDNLILTRILRLEGLEEGINKGGGVDSYERYIYIHGTGREDLIGTPLSHGCVCLRNLDIIRLFDTVKGRHAGLHRSSSRRYQRTSMPQRSFYRNFRQRYERARAIPAFSGNHGLGVRSFPFKRRYRLCPAIA